MLSGIGPKDHLKSMGINLIADMPGVGQNLQDHPDFMIKYKCLKPVTLWPKTKRLNSIGAGIQWLLTKEAKYFDLMRLQLSIYLLFEMLDKEQLEDEQIQVDQEIHRLHWQ